MRTSWPLLCEKHQHLHAVITIPSSSPPSSSPSHRQHHHQSRHHHPVIIRTITFIPSSPRPSSPSPDIITTTVTSSPLLWHHHHYCDIITTTVTSSPLLWHHHHYCDIITTTVTSSPLLWHHHHYCDIITTTVTSSPLLRHLRHHLHPLSPSPSPPPSAPPPLSTRFWIPVASRQSLFNWPERTVFLFSSSQKDSHLTDVFLRAVEHPRWPENKENWWSHVLVRQPLSGLKTNRSGLSLLRDFCAVSPPSPHLSCVTAWFLRNQLTEIEDNKVSFCPLRSLQQILVSVWRNWLSWISRGREMFISVTLLFWEKWQARAISGVATLKAKYSCGPMH